MSNITREHVINAIEEVLGTGTDTDVIQNDQLVEVLEELGVEHPEALMEWYGVASIDVDDILQLCTVHVEHLCCDNCSNEEYRCHPPNDDWSNFQGCQSPYEIGLKFETRSFPTDVFVCSHCVENNPAFAMLSCC